LQHNIVIPEEFTGEQSEENEIIFVVCLNCKYGHRPFIKCQIIVVDNKGNNNLTSILCPECGKKTLIKNKNYG